MISTSQPSTKRYQREVVPIVTLAEIPTVNVRPWTPTPRLGASQITPDMDDRLRQVARVFPGTRIEIAGVLRTIAI